ncbi:MAG: hypothetical protein LUH19_00340 [Lachnospiraceae bacterium]|nr:hypothetical protein [Lachnospiraceae bacterium]
MRRLSWLLEGVVIAGALGYFFYRSVIGFMVLLLAVPPLYLWQQREYLENVRMQITLGFKEWLVYLKSELQAGYSPEQAVLRVQIPFCSYIGEKHPLCPGLYKISAGLKLHQPLERLLAEYGADSGISYIAGFARTFAIVKQRGGSMSETLDGSIRLICERIETVQEIESVISAKKLEHKFMCIIPFGILLFVGRTAPGYFDTLYHNLTGIAVMTGALAVYLFSVVLGERMTKVDL